ncbi:MAG TPA: GDP-mannose 4,6-dehydratase [Acidimicrobiia bacterium]|nr:GDP-mannose 4,6-dehydratase [Acidimicrobiia bacterium]
MRAAITGARGFAGRHLAAHLLDEGDDVVGLDVVGETPIDVTDADAVLITVSTARPEVLYHLAAWTHVGESFGNEDAVQRVNVDGTANVLAACVAGGVRRVVVVGSSEEYGSVGVRSDPIREDEPLRPLSPYARTKVAAEELALTAGRDGPLEVVCVRSFSHTGPGQSPRFLVPGLAARIVVAERTGRGEIVIGNLDPVRDYSDVRDVVRAYRMLADRGEPGHVYNVCSGHGRSVAEIATALLELADRRLQLVVDPELVRPTDVPRLVGDGTRLRLATGWQPAIPFERTLADVLGEARAAPG